MPLQETFTQNGEPPEWVKEGMVVAVVHEHRGNVTIEKNYVERLTKTLVILNDGKRYNLKAGLREYGYTRSTWGPRAPFLTEWDSAAVKSALREQFLRDTARLVEQKAHNFAAEPDGKKAVELIELLTRWAKLDGMEVPK